MVYEIPGPVRQLVVRETLTVAFSCRPGPVILGVAVYGRGELVRDAVIGEGEVVSVVSTVSVTVGLLVFVNVMVGVSEGVKVGGGSSVGVKVDFRWNGVFVEVPLRVYFSDVWISSQALNRPDIRINGRTTFKNLNFIIIKLPGMINTGYEIYHPYAQDRNLLSSSYYIV